MVSENLFATDSNIYGAIPMHDGVNEQQNIQRNGSTGRAKKIHRIRANKACLLSGLAFLTLIFVTLAGFRNALFKHNEDKGDLLISTTSKNIVQDVCTIDPIEALKASSTVENLSHGAVSADDARCSEVGASILRDLGGNAIDAAVATTLCLQVVNPASSSLGGGAFILIHADANSTRVSTPFEEHRETPVDLNLASGKVTEVIDCREICPKAASWDMFEGLPPEASWNGGLSIATMGQLRGLELAHSRYGRLPWASLVEPAVKLARYGVLVSAYLAHAINLSDDKIFQNKDLAWLMTKNHDGISLLQEGDVITNPALADTFEVIMDQGADAIYKGKIAETIARDIQEAGGIITTEDLADYRPVIRDPLVAHDVAGYSMVGIGPPAGGALVIGIARFLSGYAEPFVANKDTLSQHRMVEAMKHIYAIRMSLSDPDFYSNVTIAAVADLIGGTYIEELRKMTSDDHVLNMSQYGGPNWGVLNDGEGYVDDRKVAVEDFFFTEIGNDNRRRLRRASHYQNSDKNNHRDLRLFQYLQDHGTTHIAIIDNDRNSLTMTTTINTYFGSCVVSPSTGIIFNSQMDDFASPGAPNFYGMIPSISNYIEPGKKPVSSMSPTLLFHGGKKKGISQEDLGNLVMAFGGSGGPHIPTAVVQVFANHILLGMPLYESIVKPRLHNQLLWKGRDATFFDKQKLLQGPTIEVENKTKNALKRRGQEIFPVSNTGTVQAVSIDEETGKITAVSDIRKGGCAAGY